MTTTLIDPELEEQFDLLIATIRTIRNLRAEAEIKPGVKVPIILQSENPQERQILDLGQSYVRDLGKVEALTVTPTLESEYRRVFAGVVGTIQVLMPLSGIADIDALRTKLEKQLSKIESEVNALTSRLNNPGFVNNAPTEVVRSAREALAEAQKQVEILRDRLERLK
jgi:valyl-tRNA synthetase